MEEKETKQAIKHDILDNLDIIVNKIYEYMSESVFVEEYESKNIETKSDDIYFILSEIEDRRFLQQEIDKFLGKEDCPPPITNKDGSVEVYNEIDVNGICEKIDFANDIFTTDYKFTYKKGTEYKDLPETIKKVINFHTLMKEFEETKNYDDLKIVRSYLISLALIGHIRFYGKANRPYLLDSEIETTVKRFMKNVECLCDILAGTKYMSDPNENGLDLWDTTSTFSSRKIKFIKKKQ